MNLSYLEEGDDLYSRLSSFIPTAGSDLNIKRTVAEILDSVQKGGNKAILEKTSQFDGASLSAEEMQVKPEQLENALLVLSSLERQALEDAIANVTLFHKQSFPKNWKCQNLHGGLVGEQYYPIHRVGIYVPGGQVPLVSTVIMTVTLAKVAGVPEIVVATPPHADGQVSSHLLAALKLSGVTEVYKIGGAQAIGALAYGSETIRPVDKIFGPGNAFVNEAKRQVFGEVGIDLLPGPSEVMVIADHTARPECVAAALLAQAEHGSGKEKIYLLFQEKELFKKVVEEIDQQLPDREHESSIRKVLDTGFFAIFLPEQEGVAKVANFIAPEHLELQVSRDACDFYLQRITTAGAFLVGHETPTSVGDFAAGPSHVLPTGRSSRFSSGLRMQDFLRRSSVIHYNAEACQNATQAIAQFASMENLDGHGFAHQVRVDSAQESAE
ncbi:MAG: histidinol dehydrogenase [Opitutae bacterium]